MQVARREAHLSLPATLQNTRLTPPLAWPCALGRKGGRRRKGTGVVLEGGRVRGASEGGGRQGQAGSGRQTESS